MKLGVIILVAAIGLWIGAAGTVSVGKAAFEQRAEQIEAATR